MLSLGSMSPGIRPRRTDTGVRNRPGLQVLVQAGAIFIHISRPRQPVPPSSHLVHSAE